MCPSERPTRRQALAFLGQSACLVAAGCTTPGGGGSALAFEHPETVRTDEPFGMTIDGLPSNATVDLVLEGEAPSGGSFGAAASVETGEGPLDVTEAAVVGGDLPAELDVPIPTALIQSADTTWWRFHPARGDERYQWPDENAVTYRVETDEEVLGTTSVTRRYPAVDSFVEPADELAGRVYEPPGDGPAPGVLVLHGSDGEPRNHVASQLAQHGFTAFALEYFDGPGLPDTLVEIPLEYVERAVEWLLDYRTVSGDRVGLWGISRGAELALLVGSEFDRVGPVVSIVGSGVVVPGLDAESAAWTLDGEPITPLRSPPGEASPDEIEAATIPVEEIDGSVLLVTGGDDELWPPWFHEVAAERLEEHDHPSFDHRRYEDAGHGIFQPYFPLGRTYGGGYGGTLAGNAEAAHDHWPHVLETLSTLRGGRSYSAPGSSTTSPSA